MQTRRASTLHYLPASLRVEGWQQIAADFSPQFLLIHIFRNAKAVSVGNSVIRVNFQLEARDSTHQDWNEFHIHEEEEYDDWELTSNIKPSGIELAPNLRSEGDEGRE